MTKDIHRRITRNVIPGGGWEKVKCCDDGDEDEIDPEEIIVDANVGQDDIFCGQFHNEYHFDCSAFKEGLAYLEQQWALVRAWDALVPPCCDCDNMESALEAFGRLLHGLQDFYSHTIWVEEHQNQPGHDLWDPATGVPSTVGSNWWLTPFNGPPGAPGHGDVNKDDPGSEQGGKPVQSGPHAGKTLHQLAVEYAQAATAAAFQKFRAVAKNTTHCIEHPLDHPCAPCAKKEVARSAKLETRVATVRLPREGLAAALSSEPAAALDAAAAAMIHGQGVPLWVYSALQRVDVAELEELNSVLLRVVRELDGVETPESALFVARSVIAMEALRRLDPARASYFVRSRYSEAMGSMGRDIVLSTASRIHSSEIAAFFVGRLLDEAPAGREGRVYDHAIGYLTRFFKDGYAQVDVSDAAVRKNLKSYWGDRLGV